MRAHGRELELKLELVEGLGWLAHHGLVVIYGKGRELDGRIGGGWGSGVVVHVHSNEGGSG